MKKLRYVVRGSRSVARASDKQVCDGIEKCVTGLFSIPSHTIMLYINNLAQCVTSVTSVTAFLSCIYNFSKTAFYFLKRTLTQKSRHTRHTSLQPACLLGFYPLNPVTHPVTHCSHMGSIPSHIQKMWSFTDREP